MTRFIFIMIAIAAIGYFLMNNLTKDNVREKSIDFLKLNKPVQTMDNSRNDLKNSIDGINSGELR